MSIRALVLGLVLVQALLAGAVYRAVDVWGENAARQLAEERLSLLADTLLSALDRFVALPDMAGESRSLAALLRAPEAPEVRERANRFLDSAAGKAGLAALYVMNDKGLTLAASNWREPGSFVGRSYAFRPYFTEAMREGRARFYGVGVTTGQPGYFLSSRVQLDDGAVGVVAAKIDFSALRASWTAGGEHVFVSDEDGIVFLSTEAGLLYRPLRPLSPPRAEAIRQEQRYADHGVGPGIEAAEWPAGRSATRALAGTPWQMSVVVPAWGKVWAPAGAAALAVLASLVPVLGVAALRQRRARLAAERAAYAALESRVAERTRDLAGALVRLEQEITERQRIDGELHRARDELVQAAKLSAMGRAFSGLAHELNQPLAALRTYLASTRALLARRDTAQADANIGVMEGEIGRLATLTRDLRDLSRRSDSQTQDFDLAELVGRVAALLKFRLADAGVALDLACPGPVPVRGNANRLEQVVLNLMLNAVDAVAEVPEPRIRVEARVEEGRALLLVADGGPGIPEALRGQIFEPFFTTKEDGVGLGLAISYAIVRDHFGTLRYRRTGAGETQMILTLPLGEAAPQQQPEDAGHGSDKRPTRHR